MAAFGRNISFAQRTIRSLFHEFVPTRLAMIVVPASILAMIIFPTEALAMQSFGVLDSPVRKARSLFHLCNPSSISPGKWFCSGLLLMRGPFRFILIRRHPHVRPGGAFGNRSRKRARKR